jgi:dTDP-4-amino-4,6-dideoxygalactose transaminase
MKRILASILGVMFLSGLALAADPPAASQPALGAARCAPGSFPEAERACAEAISIPVRPSCPPATIEHIADVIRRALVRS